MKWKSIIQKNHLALSYNLIDFIEQHQTEILNILCTLASYQSVMDEIARSKHVLLHWPMELQREQPAIVDKITVFHSSNILLYSYILYGIVPSAYAERIVIRPSQQVQTASLAIHQLFTRWFDLPITMELLSQKHFIAKHQDTTVVVFTGRYENAREVNLHFPQALFLFFGSGVNATIIGKRFDISHSLKTLIQTRLFNSGQDCMCPNSFFVHKAISKTFIDTLLAMVKTLKFGERTDTKADYNPIFYEQVIQDVEKYLHSHQEAIIHSGRCYAESGILDPVVLVSEFDGQTSIQEFFSPVFDIVLYDDPAALNRWLLSAPRTENSMCLSLFGESDIHTAIYQHYTVALEKTLFTQEDGNLPFGGYGPKANYVRCNQQFQGRPILISREVAHYFGKAQSR